MTRFGGWLTREREARGWTLEELGTYLGVDKSMVLRWESGETYTQLPSFARLMRLLCADANKVLRLVPIKRDDAAAA
jgi:transcriptional regulator with XRE-family HTH domain